MKFFIFNANSSFSEIVFVFQMYIFFNVQVFTPIFSSV